MSDSVPKTIAESAIARFRQHLKAGQVLLGAAVTFADPAVTAAMAEEFDFLWVDQEHAALSPEALSAHLWAARAKDVPVLVRVAASGAPFIKPVLDAGADGIVVPQVRSAEEVRGVVADCRYPPSGRRGFGPRVPSNFGRDSGPAFVERANREVFVVAMIETAEAIAALDEILAIPGLDSLMLGPWDLSGALGVLGEVEHPHVVHAVETVIAKARAAGLSVGSGMGASVDYACTMARRGVQWIQMGGDYEYMIQFAAQMTASVKERLTPAPYPEDTHA